VTPARTLIVGIGSAHGDDQSGLWAARRLAHEAPPERAAVRVARAPSDLLDWLDGVERLIVCDAYRADDPRSGPCRWVWPAVELQAVRWSGTHNLGLCEVLALAQVLGRLPRSAILWGIPARTVGIGEAMSAASVAAATSVVAEILQELDQAGPGAMEAADA
jgi:hydrogenase maturation protease